MLAEILCLLLSQWKATQKRPTSSPAVCAQPVLPGLVFPNLSVCSGHAPGAWEGLSLQLQRKGQIWAKARGLCCCFNTSLTKSKQHARGSSQIPQILGRAPILQGTAWEEELEEWRWNWVSGGKRQTETQKTWARRTKKENKWQANRVLGRESWVKSRRSKTKWRTGPS